MGTVGALPTLGSIGSASVKKRKTQTGTDAGNAKKSAGGAFQCQESWGSGGIAPGNRGPTLRVCKGRCCFFCDGKDADEDPCFPGEKLIWGYPLNKDETVNGEGCVSCVKTFNAQFKCRVGKMKGLKTRWSEFKDEFGLWRNTCVNMVKTSGKLGVTLKGGAAESEFDKMRQKVTHKRIREQLIEEHDDEVWEEKKPTSGN